MLRNVEQFSVYDENKLGIFAEDALEGVRLEAGGWEQVQQQGKR